MEKHPEEAAETSDPQSERATDYHDQYPEAYGKERFPPEKVEQMGDDMTEFAAGMEEWAADLKSQIAEEMIKAEPDPELLARLQKDLEEAQAQAEGTGLWAEEIKSGEAADIHEGFRKENDAAFKETMEADLRQKLESQFDQPDEIELADGSILQVIDLNPGIANLKDQAPLIMIQGLAQDARQIKENMVLMGIAGHRVFAVNGPYGIDVNNLPADIAEKTKDVPEIERRKAATLYEAVDHIRKKTGAEQVKAITISEGSIILAETAAAQPEWFSDAILVEPAGMTEDDSAARLTLGGVADGLMEGVRIKKAEIENNHNINLSNRLVALQRKLGLLNPKGFDPEEAKKNVAISQENAARSTKNDFERIVGAIPIIAKYRIGPILKKLREKKDEDNNDKHYLQFVVVSGVEDKYFKTRKMREYSEAEMMDGSLVVKGGHGQMTIQPKPYTAAFDNILDNLETKRKKRPTTNSAT